MAEIMKENVIDILDRYHTTAVIPLEKLADKILDGTGAPDLYAACRAISYMWRDNTPAYKGQKQEAGELLEKALAKVEGK